MKELLTALKALEGIETLPFTMSKGRVVAVPLADLIIALEEYALQSSLAVVGRLHKQVPTTDVEMHHIVHICSFLNGDMEHWQGAMHHTYKAIVRALLKYPLE